MLFNLDIFTKRLFHIYLDYFILFLKPRQIRILIFAGYFVYNGKIL